MQKILAARREQGGELIDYDGVISATQRLHQLEIQIAELLQTLQQERKLRIEAQASADELRQCIDKTNEEVRDTILEKIVENNKSMTNTLENYSKFSRLGIILNNALDTFQDGANTNIISKNKYLSMKNDKLINTLARYIMIGQFYEDMVANGKSWNKKSFNKAFPNYEKLLDDDNDTE